MKYIALDTETGCINHSSSLLTAFFQVYDSNYTPTEFLKLTLKPDDGLYVVSAGGLKVNGINLVEHDAAAITYKEGAKILYDFLNTHTEQGKSKLYAIGLGLDHDLQMLTKYLLSPNTLAKFISVKKLDVLNIALFMKMLGLLPPDLSHSLKSLADHYAIEWTGPAHDAQADAIMSANVLFKMIRQLVDLQFLGRAAGIW